MDDEPRQPPPHVDQQVIDILSSLKRRWEAGEMSEASYLKRCALVLEGAGFAVNREAALGPAQRNGITPPSQ